MSSSTKMMAGANQRVYILAKKKCLHDLHLISYVIGTSGLCLHICSRYMIARCLINSLGGRLKQLFMVSITSFLSQTFFPSMLVNCKGMGKAVFRPLFLQVPDLFMDLTVGALYMYLFRSIVQNFPPLALSLFLNPAVLTAGYQFAYLFWSLL